MTRVPVAAAGAVDFWPAARAAGVATSDTMRKDAKAWRTMRNPRKRSAPPVLSRVTGDWIGLGCAVRAARSVHERRAGIRSEAVLETLDGVDGVAIAGLEHAHRSVHLPGGGKMKNEPRAVVVARQQIGKQRGETARPGAEQRG